MIANVSHMAKVPEMVKQAVLNLKEDVEQLVKQSMKIANELPDLKQKGQKCYENHLSRPGTCYEHSFGPIKYSHKARVRWERYMRLKYARNKVVFNANLWPKTHMKK